MKIIALLCFAVCTLAVSVSGFGQIAWDQQPDTSVQGIINQEIPDIPALSTYLVNDITISQRTLIRGVTVYFTNSQNTWEGNVTEARLFAFPDDFSTFDPSLDGQIVPVVVTDVGDNVLVIEAEKLFLPLDAGTHWIGLTPVAPSGLNQEFSYAANDLVGELTVARNPEGGLGVGTDWVTTTNLLSPFMDLAITLTEFPLTPPKIAPNSFTTIRGVQISGTLSDLFKADDQTLVFQPGFVINPDEAPVWLRFDGILEDQIPGGIEIESQAGTPGLTLTVEEFNWDTQSYETISEENESFNIDSIKIHALTRHISPDDEVRIRAGWRRTGFTINFPWEVRIDSVIWIPCI